MNRDWGLFFLITVLTLIVSIALIRWLAPGLLGITGDLQLVQVSREVPPFYENVFRSDNPTRGLFLLNDPITKVRALPKFPNDINIGPHDYLGFRNREIPNVADLVVIGDSQTYGNNALMEENWPGWLLKNIQQKGLNKNLYNISVGGWGALQYLYMVDKALTMDPEVVIVAFYTGNDAIESFQLAYADERWKQYRPNKSLSAEDMPKIHYPPKPDEVWKVVFQDGVIHEFTPLYRYGGNQPHPVIDAGYEIMAIVAETVAEKVSKSQRKLFFTIIPTAELIYSAKIDQEGISRPKVYDQLVAAEKKRIEVLANRLKNLETAAYIDLLAPLSVAAMENKPLYPSDSNGHPVSGGYKAIADVISETISDKLENPKEGLYMRVTAAGYPDNRNGYLLNNGKLHYFDSPERLMGNGWIAPYKVKPLNMRMLNRYPVESVRATDYERYGPK